MKRLICALAAVVAVGLVFAGSASGDADTLHTFIATAVTQG